MVKTIDKERILGKIKKEKLMIFGIKLHLKK